VKPDLNIVEDYKGENIRVDFNMTMHQVIVVIFVTLAKFKVKPTKETIAENLRLTENEVKEGIKNLTAYWTLGRYDAVVITEAPDEKRFMRSLLRRAGWLSSETLVAMPAEEARKLVEA
jgi:uncharacterized protein with GYD domain